MIGKVYFIFDFFLCFTVNFYFFFALLLNTFYFVGNFATKKRWSEIVVSVPVDSFDFLDVDISGTYKLYEKCDAAQCSLHKRIPLNEVFFYLVTILFILFYFIALDVSPIFFFD